MRLIYVLMGLLCSLYKYIKDTYTLVGKHMYTIIGIIMVREEDLSKFTTISLDEEK